MNTTFRDAADTAADPGPDGAVPPLPVVAAVIPMLNEEGAVADLLAGCAEHLAGLGAFEICVVNDGSTDGTAAALEAFRDENPDVSVTIVTHPSPAGQSASVHAGVRASRAPIICTLDGDGQNPPSELPKLLAPIMDPDADPELGLVAGQRVKRQDTISKRLASRAANAIRRTLLKDGTRDTGCGLKAFRRDAFLELPFFNHMHRYLPALFLRDGWKIDHVEVAHAERTSGTSKYTNLSRAIVGATDLLGVAWLVKRKRRTARGAAEISYGWEDRS